MFIGHDEDGFTRAIQWILAALHWNISFNNIFYLRIIILKGINQGNIIFTDHRFFGFNNKVIREICSFISCGVYQGYVNNIMIIRQSISRLKCSTSILFKKPKCLIGIKTAI